MVWDHKVSVIVMASGLVEGQASRCPRYWPTRMGWRRVPAPTNRGDVRGRSKWLYIGPFRVKLVRERSSIDMVVTTLKLYMGPEGPHTVQHLWLPQWAPNMDEGTKLATLNYVQRMHELRRSSGPLLLHCDTGASRTGLLIGASLITQQYYFGKQFDILAILCQLRQDRGSLLDTAGAYIILHRIAAQLVRMNADSSIDELLRTMFANEPAAPVIETRIAMPADDAVSVSGSLLGEDLAGERKNYLDVGSKDEGRKVKAKPHTAADAVEAEWSLSEDEDENEHAASVSTSKTLLISNVSTNGNKSGGKKTAKVSRGRVSYATVEEKWN